MRIENSRVKRSERATTAVLKAMLKCVTIVPLLSSHGKEMIYRLKSNGGY